MSKQMNKQYLEDFAAGQVFKTERKRVDKAEIFAFAKEYDPQPFHLDEEAARLLQYQQSYQAAAKILQIAQTIFDSLLQA